MTGNIYLKKEVLLVVLLKILNMFYQLVLPYLNYQHKILNVVRSE